VGRPEAEGIAMTVPRSRKLARRRSLPSVPLHWQIELVGGLCFLAWALLATYLVAGLCYALAQLTLWVMA
jgi:lipid-A-disaccharide synthase-like uncharacterized protein